MYSYTVTSQGRKSSECNALGQGRSKSIQKFYDSVPATNVILATVAGHLAQCVHAEPVVLLTSLPPATLMAISHG